VRPVPAVARLGERVGREHRERLGRHQVGDRGLDVRVAQEVEVVHHLASFVTHVSVVLELCRPLHEARTLLRAGTRGVQQPRAMQARPFGTTVSPALHDMPEGGE
jgi:hypothetical protein